MMHRPGRQPLARRRDSEQIVSETSAIALSTFPERAAHLAAPDHR